MGKQNPCIAIAIDLLFDFFPLVLEHVILIQCGNCISRHSFLGHIKISCYQQSWSGINRIFFPSIHLVGSIHLKIHVCRQSCTHLGIILLDRGVNHTALGLDGIHRSSLSSSWGSPSITISCSQLPSWAVTAKGKLAFLIIGLSHFLKIPIFPYYL